MSTPVDVYGGERTHLYVDPHWGIRGIVTQEVYTHVGHSVNVPMWWGIELDVDHAIKRAITEEIAPW